MLGVYDQNDFTAILNRAETNIYIYLTKNKSMKFYAFCIITTILKVIYINLTYNVKCP